MAAAAVALLQVRLGLLAVEVQEERVRVGALLSWAQRLSSSSASAAYSWRCC